MCVAILLSYPINGIRATSLSYCGATTSFRKLGYAAVYNYSMKIFKYHDGIFWTNRPHITNRPHMRAICKNFRERGGEQKNFLKSGFFTLRWFPPLSLKFSQTPTSDTNAGRVLSPDRHWSLSAGLAWSENRHWHTAGAMIEIWQLLSSSYFRQSH